MADCYGELSEAEARLVIAYRNTEPGVAERIDHWHAQELAVLLSIHRKKGAPPTTAKSLHPGWGFAGKSAAEQRSSAAATTAAWKAFAKANAGKKKGKKRG